MSLKLSAPLVHSVLTDFAQAAKFSEKLQSQRAPLHEASTGFYARCKALLNRMYVRPRRNTPCDLHKPDDRSHLIGTRPDEADMRCRKIDTYMHHYRYCMFRFDTFYFKDVL